MTADVQLMQSEIPLLTDLYQLTVTASLFEHGFTDLATFEVATRRMPPNRGYLVAAGLERVLEILEEFRFDEAALAHLESLKLFKAEFLDHLSRLRFTGEVRAMPEGAVFFAGEPVVEIHAPIIEAQLVEPLVLNQIGFASLCAAKAARCFSVAGGRRLVDFGLRRAQGADAAMTLARSSYLCGFHGTSNVLAGKRYGIPAFGTMSHSYIMAHDNEREAFEHFVKSFPDLSTLLVDTYDTVRGVQIAAEIGKRLKAKGLHLRGVRLDSGDIFELARQSRRVLDDAGLHDTAIFASGNLDEYRIAELIEAGAPIDAFGVGTALAVSDDAPAGDFTYKLTEYRGSPRIKTSTAKVSMPGRKQVFRAANPSGTPFADLVGLSDESAATAAREFKPAPAKVAQLLEPQMQAGKRVAPARSLAESRERFMEEFAALDGRHKSIRRPAEYSVKHTAALNAMIISEKLRAESRQE
ncbi:MAG: nicotinate phosphoribosyltransferase [Candidatus Binataceae bacterium]